MAEQKHVKFADLLALHIDNTIKRKFLGEQLTPDSIYALRVTIHETINSIFSASRFKLERPALWWLTDQYFKRIKINGGQPLSESVNDNEYNLSQLPYHEVELLRNLFGQTGMAQDLEAEYRRRVLS